jgi:hypothetical protein
MLFSRSITGKTLHLSKLHLWVGKSNRVKLDAKRKKTEGERKIKCMKI